MKTAALILLLLLPVVAGLIAWPRWKITVSKSLFTHREELRAAVPQEAKVFAGENISPHIYLYHLDKKGWHIAEGELNPDVMRIRVGQGGEYLYNDDPALESHPVIAPWLDTLVAEIGDFRIWKLKKPEEVPVAGS